MSVAFRPFLAGDAVQIALQPSQHVTLGLARPFLSFDDGLELEQSSATAWTATGGGRVLACGGLQQQWPAGPGTAGHVLAWALLAAGLGPAHVAITRFFRRVIDEDPATRVEAIVRADVAAECRWARLVGLELCAVLRAWGPEGKTHLLFDRVRDAPGGRAHPAQPRRGTRFAALDRPLRLEALGAS